MWLLGSTADGSELRSVTLGERGSATMLKSFELPGADGAALALTSDPSLQVNRLLMADRTSGDLLQWRIQFPEVLLDQPARLPRGSMGPIAAIAAHRNRVWIASRTALFSVKLPD